MSIRIHELAKKIGMDNKVLLALLKERKYDVKSVSSTIDNISAEALVDEFKSHVPTSTSETAGQDISHDVSAEAHASEAPVAEEKHVGIPKVKSAQEVADERKAREDAAKAEPAPAASHVEAPAATAPAVPAPAAPVASAPVSTPPPAPAIPAAPASKAPPALVIPGRSAPPVPPAMPKAPSPVSAPPSLPAFPKPASSPVSAPPVIVKAPGVVPVPLRAPGSSPTPPPAAPAAPVSAPAPVAIPQRAPAPVAPAPMNAPKPLPTAPAPAPLNRPVPPPPIPAPAAPTMRAPGVPGAFPVSAPKVEAAPSAPGEIKTLHLKPPVVLRDFATALGMKPFQLISELMGMGIFASMTQSLDEAVAVKVAEKHGCILEIKHRGETVVPQKTAKEKEVEKKKQADEDEVKNLAPRPPVVCILGHVDHGKTSLLDAIRKANVAAGEAGGITQHIGAYQIEHNGKKITFLDTPGHAAFNKMRARGASVTDIAILVVAADDGFMPQTDEALKHIQNSKVTLMVAVNKMDVKGANLEQVKAMMQQRNIAPEDWGGETVTCPVSAIKGTGIPEMLEMILLQTEVLELKANPKADASGVIIESQMEVGRGPLATVIVQRGTLRNGDALVCGQHWCKVRAMFDDQGRTIKEAPPSTPVRVIGWSGTPESGATFKAVKNVRDAESIAEVEQLRIKKEAVTEAAAPKETSVEKLFASIAANQAKCLKVIIKTDVFGSSEAVRNVLEGIKSTKVSLEIVSIEVGLITKNDVLMASTGGAVILGFNTKLENGVTPEAKHRGVRIETYSIIYEMADKVRDMMADLLEPDLKEVKLGAAEVRATFPLAKGFVAGCLVTEGKITRNAMARLRRGREIVTEGKVATLKRFKDDANEVRAGLECGIKLGDYNGYDTGDIIEVYEVQKVRAAL